MSSNFTSLDMSWRSLQHVFSVTILRLPWRLEDVLNTSWRRLAKTFWIRLEDLLQDVFKTSWKMKNCYAEDVLKTSWRHVLKTSWRCLEGMSWRPLKDFMETNKILTGISVYLSRDLANLNVYLTSLYFTNLYLTALKQIQNALITGDWFGVIKLASFKFDIAEKVRQ